MFQWYLDIGNIFLCCNKSKLHCLLCFSIKILLCIWFNVSMYDTDKKGPCACWCKFTLCMGVKSVFVSAGVCSHCLCGWMVCMSVGMCSHCVWVKGMCECWCVFTLCGGEGCVWVLVCIHTVCGCERCVWVLVCVHTVLGSYD